MDEVVGLVKVEISISFKRSVYVVEVCVVTNLIAPLPSFHADQEPSSRLLDVLWGKKRYSVGMHESSLLIYQVQYTRRYDGVLQSILCSGM